MKTYIIRRILFTILMLFGITIMTFIISHIVPGDPVIAILGERGTDEQIAFLRHKLGLDQPLWKQYIIYMVQLSHLDMGVSIRTNRPVAKDLAHYFPATFELSTFAIFLSILLGIPAGIISAIKKDKWIDHFTRIFSLLGVSIPVFWLGLILLALFYAKLGILPSSGRIDMFIDPPTHITGLYLIDSLLTGNWAAFISSLRHLILPAICLGYLSMARIVRMMRSSMLEVLSQDYIRTAKATGLSWRKIIWKYALKNAFIPTLTVIGLSYGSLLSGAVLTETIFSWPGLGKYVVDSALFLDFSAIMGVTLIIALIYSIANMIVDILYSFFDPRVSLS